MNILLDSLPTEYEGYHINTDFRVGIKLNILFNDNSEDENDKIDDAIDLLFGSGVPTTLEDDNVVVDYNTIFDCINWFMSGGNPDNKKTYESDTTDAENGGMFSDDIAYDFEEDAGYIYAAFLQVYNIDLLNTNMHWFRFLSLFIALKDTVFNRLQEIRTQDISNLKGKERVEAQKQKDRFKVNRATRISAERKAMLQQCYGDEWESHI